MHFVWVFKYSGIKSFLEHPSDPLHRLPAPVLLIRAAVSLDQSLQGFSVSKNQLVTFLF